MVARAALLVWIVACGGKSSVGEDAMRTRDGAAPSDASGSGSGSGSAAPRGEAAIRVEWKAVPTAARQSPGRTACNTARAAAVAPTTLWAIPDAIVLADQAPPPGEVRVVLADCAVTPRIALASTLIVESTLDRPATLALAKHGTIATLGALAPTASRPIQLPIAGHAVAIPLAAGGVYRLALDGPDGEVAWIVNARGGVTDAAGLATLRLPVGPHPVTAWLPARGGQPAKLARSTVTVEPDQLAELALDLGR